MSLAIYVAVVGTIAVVLALWQFLRDKGKLRISLQIVDATGSYGLIVDNKDHLMVKAVNIGKRSLVLQAVTVNTSVRWMNTFKRPEHVGRGLLGPGMTFAGGSFEDVRQVDPGHTFSMLLDISSGVLVGYHTITAVHIPDSIGTIHRTSFLQIMKVRYQLSKQYPEWRERLKPNKENPADS